MLFEYHPSPDLPALAWVAHIAEGRVEVDCGTSVRRETGGFLEGSWAGDSGLTAVGEATTVFGSGIVADGDGVLLVPPTTTLESVFVARCDGALVASNSLVGLLVAGGLELDPAVPYPTIFGRVNLGLEAATAIEVPTKSVPIAAHYFENVAIGGDLSLALRPKPREAPFRSFDDYRDRLVERTRSVFANAPGYEPAVAISSGYDSTASAAVASQAGCRRALTIRTGRPWRGYRGTDDSGALAARALGLEVAEAAREDYLALDDAPEAEFLASGMTGEDAPLRSFGDAARRTVLVTGYWGGAAWRDRARPGFARLDLSGASLAEFRLRSDFVHLPLPFIGGTEQPSVRALLDAPEMDAFRVRPDYDEPTARRLAEEAGVARGTFAVEKRAATTLAHRGDLDELSASTRRSFESFAGRQLLERLPRRAPFGRRHRLALRVAAKFGPPGLARALERRRQQAQHFEPALGSLLLRWAIEEIRPRYATIVRRSARNASNASAISR